MSYNAFSDLFYGVILPERCELDSDKIDEDGFEYVMFGNMLAGDFGVGIAVKQFHISEGEAVKVDFTLPSNEEIEKLNKYLTENGVEGCEFGWYNTVSYG